MKHITIGVAMLALVLAAAFVSRFAESAPPLSDDGSVFASARHYAATVRLQQQALLAFAKDDNLLAESLTKRQLALNPQDAAGHYNLACALSRQGKLDAALQSLQTAVENGFRDPSHLQDDADLAALRGLEGWKKVIAAASRPASTNQTVSVTPTVIRNRVAMVSESNVVWQKAQQRFLAFFRRENSEDSMIVIDGDDAVADLVNDWYASGTAVGLSGVLYDNHDRDHSNIDLKRFPQLARIEYAQAAALENLDNGLQHRFQFNATTLGNSSTSIVGGPYWRSQPRLACTDSQAINALALQYFGNHLYVYPEHRDYDAATEANGGHGDVFTANIPYVVVTQGSSWSDQPFLSALASTIAAFQPNVFRTLERSGMVAPTLQMIMRRCLKDVPDDATYLTGLAHPPVFDGSRLSPEAMAQMAHQIQTSNIPPLAAISVLHENSGKVGRDYFDIGPREIIFTTPAAISRICRSMNRTFRMTIDARTSRDVNGKPLTWHWAVLQGDPSLVSIETQNEQSSVATISAQHHKRRPVRPGARLLSSRIDIGVFVSNGDYFSPPAIVSLHWPEDEVRTYDGDRLQSVQYTDHAAGGPYVDPLLVTAKDWKDVYHYSASSQLTGWTRLRSGVEQRFSAEGHLVLTTDQNDRPLTAQNVVYVESPRPDKAPLLKQVPGKTIYRYEYSSDLDKTGLATPTAP